MAAETCAFISYSRLDSALANQIVADLQSLHITAWIDHESIQPGHPDWQEAIRRGMEAATVVIYIGSPEACGSEWVRSEIALAKQLGRKIVPLFARGKHWLDSAPFELVTASYLDVRDGGYEQVRGYLFREIGAHVRPPAADQSTATSAEASGTRASAPAGEPRLRESRIIPTGSPIFQVAWATARGQIATANEDASARVFDVTSGYLVSELKKHGRPVRAVAWNPLGDRVATAGDDQAIRIWDPGAGRALVTLHGHGDGLFGTFARGVQAIRSLDWSPDGALLATAGDDALARLWDAHSGKHIATLRGHERPCSSLAWSPDGAHVATASEDRTVRLWDARSGTLLGTLVGHTDAVTSVVWSSDGRRLVTAGRDASARMWNAASGQSLVTLSGHVGAVLSASWSSDGALIATGGEDETIRVWDARSGKRIQTINDHLRAVTSVEWERGRARLASASMDRTVRIWEVSQG